METDCVKEGLGLLLYVLYGVGDGSRVIVSETEGFAEIVNIGEKDGSWVDVGLIVIDGVCVYVLCKEYVFNGVGVSGGDCVKERTGLLVYVL